MKEKTRLDEDIDGVLALGCVIKGETKHDEYISNAVATGLSDITLKYNKPVTFGLLTTNTEKQAHNSTDEFFKQN